MQKVQRIYSIGVLLKEKTNKENNKQTHFRINFKFAGYNVL